MQKVKVAASSEKGSVVIQSIVAGNEVKQHQKFLKTSINKNELSNSF